jgi:hypothetical protein
MSSLLEQAIIDAKVLKETARKNAEAAILEQYSDEIKANMALLEEEDPMAAMGGDPMAGGADPLGAAGGVDPMGGAPATTPPVDLGAGGGQVSPQLKKTIEKLPAAYLQEDSKKEIEIDLDSLVDRVTKLEEEVDPNGTLTALAEKKEAEPVEEVFEVEEEELRETEEQEAEEESVEEQITLDMKPVKLGGLQMNQAKIDEEEAVAKALEAQKEDLEEELDEKELHISKLEEDLDAAIARLQETKDKLKRSVLLNKELKEGVEYLSTKMNEINLINARLLYTNKTLGNSSLNERQKQQIAEAVSKASTVNEAKVIFESVTRTAGLLTERKAGPQSLNEAISRAPSPFIPRKEKTSYDPGAERLKRLAGIIK